MKKLILASTSPYRKTLLERLGIPFKQVDPLFEEAAPGSMPPEQLVLHNTTGKASSVLARYPDATIIASDQLAVCGDMVLGKPGSKAQACAQLASLSGKRVTFLTGLALFSEKDKRCEVIPFEVFFRDLSTIEIENYVERENPVDCAGSFKSEGLGIALFDRMQGDDPTALIGLPLIRLSQWLKPLQQETAA
ncbi:MAF protein [Mariprofundus ferrinatatus]|uniref:7-methyl-GTP pyrophosphatase n=1 Tax=Mariprofundus ferrinatatus TaxID=1921087 RepID=A0A2K8L8Z5_9PROT|nr:Maf family protein [Mariprofundus ferrinatatus]ATX82729.1 MAF protein [Mariprofundus ferrinatatus]